MFATRSLIPDPAADRALEQVVNVAGLPGIVVASYAMGVDQLPAAPYGAQRAAPGSGKTVALIFDDGPGASTASILSILAEYGVPATLLTRPATGSTCSSSSSTPGDHH